MHEPIRRKRWEITEGYIPGWRNGPEPESTSHGTVCVLNTCEQNAKIEITIDFADRDPVGPYRLTVPARRTRHFRSNSHNDPEVSPRVTTDASVIKSDALVVCQHTRLGSRQAENALRSTVAYAGNE